MTECKKVALVFLIGLGTISFLICLLAYRAWTKPKRFYQITGIAKGAVMGYQFGMGLGLRLIFLGVLTGVLRRLTR